MHYRVKQAVENNKGYKDMLKHTIKVGYALFGRKHLDTTYWFFLSPP